MNSISCVATYSHLVALTVVLISKERRARVSAGSVTWIWKTHTRNSVITTLMLRHLINMSPMTKRYITLETLYREITFFTALVWNTDCGNEGYKLPHAACNTKTSSEATHMYCIEYIHMTGWWLRLAEWSNILYFSHFDSIKLVL